MALTRDPIPSARDIMTERVITLSPDQRVDDAVRGLLEHGLSAAPVCDKQGRLVGVLSEFDYIGVLAESAFEGWPAGHVRDWMTSNVESVSPDEDLFALAARMHQSKHRRLIVTEDDRVVGIISRRDVAKSLAKRIKDERPPTTYQLLEHPPKGRDRI